MWDLTGMVSANINPLLTLGDTQVNIVGNIIG